MGANFFPGWQSGGIRVELSEEGRERQIDIYVKRIGGNEAVPSPAPQPTSFPAWSLTGACSIRVGAVSDQQGVS
jgi:hypothetical protein